MLTPTPGNEPFVSFENPLVSVFVRPDQRLQMLVRYRIERRKGLA
jgi:hypothetical protein